MRQISDWVIFQSQWPPGRVEYDIVAVQRGISMYLNLEGQHGAHEEQHDTHEGQHGTHEGHHGAHKRQHGAAPCYKELDETLVSLNLGGHAFRFL